MADKPIVLDHYDTLPARLLDIGPQDIRTVFPNPALIKLAGGSNRAAPLFVSTLLHGNETTSFFVLQNIARAFMKTPPPRPLLIFVGNVRAAEHSLRVMPGEADFNRIWAGGDAPESALAAAVLEEARAAGLFASIDIHNNTGANPLYGCVNALERPNLQLASLFSRICVYYTNPPTTQSIAFTELCPAVTLECGRPGEPAGIERATQFVLDVLHIDHFEAHSHAARDMKLYHTVGRIIIDPDTPISFAPREALLTLPADLERLNFTPLEAGAQWGRTRNGVIPLRVVDEDGADLTSRFFSFENGAIRLVRPATPAMLTSSEAIIRQDCLGYLMEEMPVDDGSL